MGDSSFMPVSSMFGMSFGSSGVFDAPYPSSGSSGSTNPTRSSDSSSLMVTSQSSSSDDDVFSVLSLSEDSTPPDQFDCLISRLVQESTPSTGDSSNKPVFAAAAASGVAQRDEAMKTWKTIMKANLLEVEDFGKEAFWELSSAKAGFGVENLRDGNLDTYWQSDANGPHTISVHFRRRTRITVCSPCSSAIFLPSVSDVLVCSGN